MAGSKTDRDESANSATLSLNQAIAARKELGDAVTGENAEAESQFLCIRLKERRYAIPISQVAEVLSPTGVTRVPHLPRGARAWRL